MSELFLKLLNMSITASWLILVVVVLRLVLKKAPKWINCVLWALVAVRLICPFSFQSSLSLIPDAEPVSQVLPDYKVGDIIEFDPDTGKEISVKHNAALVPVGEKSLAEGDSQPDTVVRLSGGTRIQTMDIVSAVWLAGMVILLLYALISYLRLRRRVAAAMSIGNKIWLCDAVESPFILGFFRPRIYLPSNINEGEMEHVLAHERAHLQRRDHWWKPIGYMLLAVYWFNPLIWVAYILLCRDIELACDEKVINRPETDRKAYSEALLACSVKRSTITACPLAFGEVSVRGRIKSVLNYKKPAFWIVLLAVVVCVIVAVCFLTNPKQDPVNVSTPDSITFRAEIVEIHDGYYLVEPEESWKINSADRIEVPMQNMDSSLEPQVGDVIEIIYSGEILETYPARLHEIFGIRVVEEAEEIDFGGVTTEDVGDSNVPIDTTVDHSILNGNAPFFNQPLEITEDPMTYQERLDWVKSGVVYTETLENGGESSTISLGQWQEGYGCLAYVWQPYGSPHPGVCMLTIRFADGTQARLPLPNEQTNRTAKPTSMEFKDGKFIYDVQFERTLQEYENGSTAILKGMYLYELDLTNKTLSLSLGQTESAANSTVSDAMLAAVEAVLSKNFPMTISMTVTSDRFPVYYPFGPPVFDAWDSINGRQSCRGILDHTYQKVDSIETSDTSITLKFTWQEVDWELTFYDGTDSLLVWMDGTEYYFRAIPNYEDVFLSPLGSLIRRWFDEAEFMALDGYDGKTIVIPNTGQSYLEAAQAWCEAYEGLHLKVSSGSKEFYTYVSCRVEAAEGATNRYREKGEIGENTYAFFAHTAFVPENEHALQWSMAGNTGNYEGDDPNVPNGALEYTRCGYITLEEDGWHGVIVGTGF